MQKDETQAFPRRRVEKRWPGGIKVGRRLFYRHCICANDLRQNAAGFSSISQRALQQRRRNLPKAASFPVKRNDGKKPLALCAPLPQKGHGRCVCTGLSSEKAAMAAAGLERVRPRSGLFYGRAFFYKIRRRKSLLCGLPKDKDKKRHNPKRDCAEKVKMVWPRLRSFSVFGWIKNGPPCTRLFPGKRLEIERAFPACAALPSDDTTYRAAAIRPTPAG